jgi:hypothetical protein
MVQRRCTFCCLGAEPKIGRVPLKHLNSRRHAPSRPFRNANSLAGIQQELCERSPNLTHPKQDVKLGIHAAALSLGNIAVWPDMAFLKLCQSLSKCFAHVSPP